MKVTSYYQRKEYPSPDVMPAKADIQYFDLSLLSQGQVWIPVFTGMTKKVAVGLLLF